LKAEILDQLLDEFAPPSSSQPLGEDYLLGRPGLEVDKFFVAWSAAQLEGIIRKSRKGDGAYVAYLGRLNEKPGLFWYSAANAVSRWSRSFLPRTYRG
jgi:hypothetical protein